MKINRLTSTKPLPKPDALAVHHPVAVEKAVGPVDVLADTDADRRRSRQQDLEEMEAQAMGPFEGQEQVRQSAHELLERLIRLGPAANNLVRTDRLPIRWHIVDDEA
jgi:hypothetical protein